ncbi:H-NS histone family protein [Malikia spinosa]|uniref:H-NS histone family protein n=1 Tax=Malikia spinosa TaxID=86180 RepID=UPI0011B0CE1F|nr:H-NS histone family protein [Malikia spinosa]
MKMRHGRTHSRPASPPPARQEPLTDRRFEDLLQQASAFFAATERNPEAEKQAAIAEIIESMEQYGLTVEDLRATR